MISFPGNSLSCEIGIVMFVDMEISQAAQVAAINEEQNYTCLLANWLLSSSLPFTKQTTHENNILL